MRRAITRVAAAAGVYAAVVLCYPFGSAAGPPRTAFRAAGCSAATPIKMVPTQAPGATARPGPLSHYDTRVHASFVARIDPERRATLVVKANDLEVEKTVSPDGSFTLVLTSGDDRVAASMQKAGVDVTRNGATLHLEFGQSDDKDFLAVQKLLAGSRAVRLHHIVAANLEPATATRPGGAATLLTDVFLGLLGGDVAAVDRFGRELARRRQPAPATILRARFGGEGDSCYVQWEDEVMAAWYQLLTCKRDYSIWNPLQEICNLRYYMRTECAWWQLISCCAIPIRAE